MESTFTENDLTDLISSLLGVNRSDVTHSSTSDDFDLWDSVMQLEIIAQIEQSIPGLIDFAPELPSKGSVYEIWLEVKRFQNQ
ncbi:MAG: hypothetical protein EBX92_08555 [Actinobacteria bacterium]|jgi:hypothetical protein|nr:hypothetical protein [Actinomycetota bacterium]